MSRKYLGKYFKEEKSFFKNKVVIGDFMVTADSFAEAQQRLYERMNEFKDIKVWFITPLYKGAD